MCFNHIINAFDTMNILNMLKQVNNYKVNKLINKKVAFSM